MAGSSPFDTVAGLIDDVIIGNYLSTAKTIRGFDRRGGDPGDNA
jgi:hypothetical protein